MPPIDSTSQIGTLLRSLLGREQKAGRARGPASLANRKPRAGQSKVPLDQLLLARTQSIAADDPQRKSKVLRAFLEANLLAEFGEDLANEPEFARMVTDVQAQMEADEALAAALDQVVQALVSAAPQKI